jgi:hypothetical protein
MRTLAYAVKVYLVRTSAPHSMALPASGGIAKRKGNMVFPFAGCRYPASSGGMVGGYAIAEVSLSRGAEGLNGV